MSAIDINIETDRLILRNFDEKDISQDYVNWLNDPEVNRYLSCAGVPQTMESCISYVRSYEGRNDTALIGIFLRDNDLHIGNLTLSTIDWQNKSGVIGISIGRKEYMGKGLAKEALSALVKYCFEQLGLLRLQAGVHVRNIRSVNLFTKCGFKRERLLQESSVIDGEVQDGYIVSISRTDK